MVLEMLEQTVDGCEIESCSVNLGQSRDLARYELLILLIQKPKSP